MRLLLIEDEASLRAALVPLLESDGYRVESADNGPEGLNLALDGNFDLILLDIMLPGLDGFSICRELRRRGKTLPVLMLTARDGVDDRVNGLDTGADDYLVKPFSSRELLARIRALLRRVEGSEEPPDRIRLGEVEIDFVRRDCHRGKDEIHLSARELRILEILAAATGRPVSRDDILDRAWPADAYPTTRSVDNQILALRGKLEPAPSDPRFLLTVHGVGYRLVTEQ